MKLESNPGQGVAMGAGVTAVGAVLLWMVQRIPHSDRNVQAAFLLGCMLVGIGVLSLIVGETRTVELDEARRLVVLEVRHRWGVRVVELPFDQIEAFRISTQGRASSGTRYYDLVVSTYDGGKIPLFGGCPVDGRMDRSWIESLRDRFEAAVAAPPVLSDPLVRAERVPASVRLRI